jgi:hypothetical protein
MAGNGNGIGGNVNAVPFQYCLLCCVVRMLELESA